MEIIISKVRTAKPRTEKQILNDQRLKEKFIEYHHQRKQLIENEKIMDLINLMVPLIVAFYVIDVLFQYRQI